VREIRDGFLKYDIPVDAIWFDIHYMNGYRVFTFNDHRFPDPAGLIAELKQDGINTVVIVDPGVKVDPGYPPYDQGIARNYFVQGRDGKPFTAQVWPGDANFPDFYQPEVREWWGGLHQFYTDLGVAGIWNDMNEPAGWHHDVVIFGLALKSSPVPWLEMRHGTAPDLVPHARLHNVYALLEAEATYNGLLKQRPDARPFILTRGGFAGTQRYSAVWTGDNTSSWEHLREGVTMLLNMSLSGLTFIGNDIGGFGGAPSPELYARWIEQGVFYPFCRTHTSNGTPPQEPWSFGDEVTAISREHIRLRYELLPYLYSLFEESSRTNLPIMRPMVFDFPGDAKVLNMSDQFMWGPSLLVAPVVERGASKRTVYLPEGKWYEFHTGDIFTGPAEIEMDAPLDKTPLYVREGAIIPLAPAMRHAGEQPWDPLTIRVYPGPQTSSFTIYEDDGASFAYREGISAATEIKAGPIPQGVEITIGERKGEFDPRRKLTVLQVYNCGQGSTVEVYSLDGDKIEESQVSFEADRNVCVVSLVDDGAGRLVKIYQ